MLEIRRGGDEGSVAFSPLGLASALSLVYAGARGVTRRELEEVLGFQV